MSVVVAEIMRQFNRPEFHLRIGTALASTGFRVRNLPTALQIDANAVRFDYYGPKTRGAIVSPKWTLTIRYDAGADLYDVTAQSVNADATVGTARTLEGMDAAQVYHLNAATL